MCPPRRLLGVVSGNIDKRKELSPYMRGKIIGQYEKGAKPADISRELRIADSTVRDTISLDLLRDKGYSKPRTGRPEKYFERFKRNLVHFVRREPKASMAKIRKHMGVKISNGTITRILDAVGIWHWKCKKRLYLTEEVVAKRLAWCLARKDWTIEDFRKYIFSDECSAEREAGGAQ